MYLLKLKTIILILIPISLNQANEPPAPYTFPNCIHFPLRSSAAPHFSRILEKDLLGFPF